MLRDLYRWTYRNFEMAAYGFGAACALALAALGPIVWTR